MTYDQHIRHAPLKICPKCGSRYHLQGEPERVNTWIVCQPCLKEKK